MKVLQSKRVYQQYLNIHEGIFYIISKIGICLETFFNIYELYNVHNWFDLI